MNKVKIITDSCSDLTKELLEKYNIDYAKMSTLYGGKESEALLTWKPSEVSDLYTKMRNGGRITTAQVSVEEFTRIFEKYAKKNYDIVYIGCSTKQSGSVNTGSVIASRIKAKYPGIEIYCIDSMNASMGEGMLAIEAAKKAEEGMSAEEIKDHILNIRKNVHQYVTVHTLDHLKQAGRVSGSSAFFGNLMGVKPILISDCNGVQAAYKKVKGRKKSLQAIVDLLKENMIDPVLQTVYVAHSDCQKEEVDYLVSLIKKEIPCNDVHVGYIGPIIGASIGPDCFGIWGFGNKIKYDVTDNSK